MAINKKLISFATQAQFDAQLSAGNIDNRSIVFIEDKKRIWTHGVFFDTSWDYIQNKPSTLDEYGITKEDILALGIGNGVVIQSTVPTEENVIWIDTREDYPLTHDPSIITETSLKQFVSDAEKVIWNAKETPGGAQTKATKALTDSKTYVNSKVLTDVPANAKFTDTNTVTSINGKTGVIAKADIVALGIPTQDTVYTHPSSHPASMITQTSSNRFVTDSRKSTWNGKSNLAIGETSSTAYRGDRGKIAYDHSQSAHAPTNAQKNSDITKAEIEAKLTGLINSHTHSYLSDSPQDGRYTGGRMVAGWRLVLGQEQTYTIGHGCMTYMKMGTVTQQQYDELLAAVQTGKIFPQAIRCLCIS